ncbi:MAG: hypothetical protein ACKVKF_10925 [Rhodobacterales bacterium]|nr:hypothetical protein [Puniceibacterium antarcticum]
MIRKLLVLVCVVATPVSGLADGVCFEPTRPEAAYLLDAGFSGGEIRRAFRTYFTEVEGYLNCLNETSARIRQEARAAAYDYNHVLDTYPHEPGTETDGARIAPSIRLKETGELFLNYKPWAGAGSGR